MSHSKQFNHWMPADFLSGSPSQYRVYKRPTDKTCTFKQKNIPGKKMSYLYQVGRTQVICTTRKLDLEELTSPNKVLESLDYVMVNATGSMAAYKKLEKIFCEHPHLRVLQDSGGYQLFSGSRDYVDPVSVAQRHLLLPEGRREGVGLDLPLGAGTPSSRILARAVKFQTQNNKKIRDVGYEDPLFYTSHGAEPKTRIEYLDGLIRNSGEKIEYLAISALRNIMAVGYIPDLALIAATATYCAARVKPKRLHLLGVSSTYGYLVVYLLKRRFPEIVITYDSSSYLLAAASGRFISKLVTKLPSPPQPKLPTPIMCPCNICTAMGNYFPPSLAAKGMLAHAHNFASYAAVGFLNDPHLDYLEAKHPEIVNLVFAEDDKLERNLLMQSKKTTTKSLFNESSRIPSEYEIRLTEILDRYGV